ncbi:hypothetical protein [Psychrobacter namhaensis]|uniref:hypothetical protein n=1 Tax=Psychrobacter namhaensis TaxID=292734 RepID=UPI0025794C95|nr:hypothetical protein [Psychrobacter sp. UBA3068]
MANTTMKPCYLFRTSAVFKLVYNPVPNVNDDRYSVACPTTFSLVIGIIGSVTAQAFITPKLS